jgi:rhomboid family GlyGly-CTERM serine protease
MPAAKFRPAGLRSRFLDALPLALAVALLLLVYLLGSRAALALRYERAAVAAGQWWRLLSAHLVHQDPRHLALNAAGLVALWVLYRKDASARAWLIVTIGSALGVGLGLFAFEPQLEWYVGLSGVLHGVWAAGAVFAWRRWRVESVAALALLAGKLVLELWHGGTILDPSLSLPVITAAHRYGALSGLLAALASRRASL